MSKTIDNIIKKLENVKDALDNELDNKRARYDNHSEKWFDTDAAIDAEATIDAMEAASDSIGDAIDCLEEIE